MQSSCSLLFVVFTVLFCKIAEMKKKRSTNKDLNLGNLQAFVMKGSSFATFCKGAAGREEIHKEVEI